MLFIAAHRLDRKALNYVNTQITQTHIKININRILHHFV